MHPSTQNLLNWLKPNMNLPPEQFEVAQKFHGLAVDMAESVPEGPELTTGLRKLLEAKDCCVRASMGEPT